MIAFISCLIQGVFISVLVIIFTKIIFREKIDTFYALKIMRWTLIVYAVGSIVHLVTSVAFFSDQYFAFSNRATGPYWLAFWLMLTMNSFLPMVLFSDRLGKQPYFLLAVAILMNTQRSFIVVTKYPYLEIIAHGLLFGIAALLLGNWFHKRQIRNSDC